MAKYYPNLLSPVKVGNVVLKNRLISSPSMAHYLQGTQNYPTDYVIGHYAQRAKSGAAVVTVCGLKRNDLPTPETMHFPAYDYRDPGTQNYLSMLAEGIRFYGSMPSIYLSSPQDRKWDVVSGIPSIAVEGDYSQALTGEMVPASMLPEIAECYADMAYIAQRCGFGMTYLHMCYRAQLAARFLSPLTNTREDEYGGTLENRAKFPLMIADAIKQRCGRDFLVEMCISFEDPGTGGNTVEDIARFARLAEGHVDFLQLRAPEIDPAHPTNYNPERTPFLEKAAIVKAGGTKVNIVTVGGYYDPEDSENAIASGKADFVATARAWISNPNYLELLESGRREDIRPCLRCNKCHISGLKKPYTSGCSVNPTHGLEHRLYEFVAPQATPRKLAIVGGGPAGMEAAIVAADRGHLVTLYEKSGELGGLLKHSDHTRYKWTLKAFKDYLIRQVEKRQIRVMLNTAVGPEELAGQKYDRVLIALGSSPIRPKIPGVEGSHVFLAPEVYGMEEKLARQVVVVGGGEIGVETGMYLADRGHEVTVVEALDRLADDACPVHFRTMFREAWQSLATFHEKVRCRVVEICKDKVVCEEADGTLCSIPCGSVVLSVGMHANSDEAMTLAAAVDVPADLIGDCVQAGDLMSVMRSAWAAAVKIE